MRALRALAPLLALSVAGVVMAAPGDGASSVTLVGKWQRAQRCEEIVRTFQRTGLSEFAAEFIVGVGFRKGPVAKVARLSNPCEGVRKPIERALVFQSNRRWAGLLEPSGEKVDGSSYRLKDAHTLETAADGGLWDAFHYTFVGDTMLFTAIRPRHCSTRVCREELAWQTETFGLGPWKRFTP